MENQRTREDFSPRVLVLGGGVAGCAVAAFLADAGVPVALAEKSGALGGKARHYCCKATSECQNCGVCLLGGLFEKVEEHPLIELLLQTEMQALSGKAQDYTVSLQCGTDTREFTHLDAVVAATGFEGISNGLSAHLEIENGSGASGLLTGSELEALMGHRGLHSLLPAPPESVAFIGCFGGGSGANEEGFYCSRVCCAYTTRAAKLLRQYYPACHMAYFYMEIQAAAGGNWMEELAALDVELIQYRPAKIVAGHPSQLSYKDPVRGLTTRSFDLVVLSEGIHPPAQNASLAHLLGLTQDASGFLQAGASAADAGLFVAGCARMPMRIEETYADAQRVAMEILAGQMEGGA